MAKGGAQEGKPDWANILLASCQTTSCCPKQIIWLSLKSEGKEKVLFFPVKHLLAVEVFGLCYQILA